jgi:endonuclease YncB( thermonuclease family)
MAAIPAVVCCHCFFLGLSSVGLAATDFSGPVVSVLDGDTIEVLHNQHPTRIRLSGIDCPEKGQAYGKKAKEAASALVFGKDVTLQTHGHDKYGRTLADVLLPDGTNVNHILGKAGWRVSHDKRVERLTRSHDPSRLEPLTLLDLGS